jgi:hypothetical protein
MHALHDDENVYVYVVPLRCKIIAFIIVRQINLSFYLKVVSYNKYLSIGNQFIILTLRTHTCLKNLF